MIVGFAIDGSKSPELGFTDVAPRYHRAVEQPALPTASISRNPDGGAALSLPDGRR
jgi:hypothetical protein